jgi:hypothetical protein
MEVLGIDHCVKGLALRVFGSVNFDETRVDTIPELRDDNDRVVDHDPGLGFVGVKFDQVGKPLSVSPLDPIDTPDPMIPWFSASTVRQDPDLVATPDRSARKLDSLRLVLFEN